MGWGESDINSLPSPFKVSCKTMTFIILPSSLSIPLCNDKSRQQAQDKMQSQTTWNKWTTLSMQINPYPFMHQHTKFGHEKVWFSISDNTWLPNMHWKFTLQKLVCLVMVLSAYLPGANSLRVSPSTDQTYVANEQFTWQPEVWTLWLDLEGATQLPANTLHVTAARLVLVALVVWATPVQVYTFTNTILTHKSQTEMNFLQNCIPLL